MAQAGRSVASRYAFAVLAVAAALAVRLLIDPWVGNAIPYLLCCIAIVAVAWQGGIGPSIVALLLGLPSVAYFFLQPRYDLAASLPKHQVQAVGFAILSLTIGLFSERMRGSQQRALAHVAESDRRRAELETEVARRELLELELQRRASALAEADRLKDEFLAMLAHELRNPLAPIRNAAEVVCRLSPDDTLRHEGETIERQVAHLGRLVDDLLDVSRITRGKITLRTAALDLAVAVARAVEESRTLLAARRHELSVVLPPNAVWVEGDAHRLSQVFANLLSNAAKYTPDGGHVRLTLAVADGRAILRVRDDGVGISHDLLPHVFDLFVQGDRSLARSEGGLGIGLTLVKSVVEMHGGSVEMESAGLGAGCEVVVRLPTRAAPQTPSANGVRRATPAPPRSRRVLAVDDNRDAVDTLALLLGMQGHEVRTAYDGPDALTLADVFMPEVVILDLGLPEMDGYEVAPRLRAREGWAGVLIVALTGYGRDEDRRRSREAGFDQHWVKPIDPSSLRELLATEGRADAP